MLRFLRVSHFAVIDSVEVEFDAGLNVLTGETGAGKSMLVEAVGLLLGGRASGDLVRTGEDTATIEAIFESGPDEILVRREISAQGRSRAFVDGALVTAGSLRDLSARLIELHGQHEHQILLDPATHVGLLDAHAQLGPLAQAAREAFDGWRASDAALAAARRATGDRESRQDLLTFQLGEIDRVGLDASRPTEDVDLATERQILVSAEKLERLCEESYALLYENDQALLGGLGSVWRRVAELAAVEPKFQPYVEARDGIKSQLEDLALFLRRYADGIDASPSRLQFVDDRLAAIERLKRKHGPSLSDVLARRVAWQQELQDLESGDERVHELEHRAAVARGRYVAAARALSSARQTAAGPFARELQSLLAELAMPHTRFDVRFAAVDGDIPPESSWTADGYDLVEFFISTNPGEDLRPLARIVSGGELSRIMLALKTLTFTARVAREGEGTAPSAVPGTNGAGAPGLIFDEVDAGIGGRVADVVGRKLHGLASGFQVLCITHLPQIAAYADVHFQIEKQVEAGRTRTTVRRVEGPARVDELARMMGGEAVTDVLRASAREMLSERSAGPAGRAKGEAKGKGESERSKAKGRRGA